MNKKVLLMILDGWGIATNPEVSAIDKAKTPFIDSLYQNYSHSTLRTDGLYVGLPEGQMGNSEVGHLNIGAGRVVNQNLVRINKAAQDGTLAQNKTLLSAFEHAKKNNTKVHFLGLVSDGGIHAHINHIKALCDAAQAENVAEFYVHALTDGRDTDPKSGLGYITDLENHLKGTNGKIASVTGRYYAMDRDKRWERVRLAYDAFVHGKGDKTTDLQESIKNSYQNEVTDEFLKPLISVDENGEPLTTISPNDVVICFNFRTDRCREITEVLTQKDFPEFEMQTLDLYFVTMTNYDASFQNIEIIFEDTNLKNTLGEVLEKAGKKQIRMAETEKYPHVTFFFSGGRETEFEGEKRIMHASPKVATYDLQPEMSAYLLRDSLVEQLNEKQADFICLNFANADMVGHTGVFEAAMKACEAVDSCAKDGIEAALANDYTVIVIADHGNSDMMINPDGSPNTAHTTNLVPVILVDKKDKINIKSGKLGDLAPTILKLMGVKIPKEMTGDVLI
jgi:2,3-bisphosphoglycerate-independent phosphoglycerate mutase